MSTLVMRSETSNLEQMYRSRTCLVKDLAHRHTQRRGQQQQPAMESTNDITRQRNVQRTCQSRVQTRARDVVRQRGGQEKMEKDISDAEYRDALEVLQKCADEDFEYYMTLMEGEKKQDGSDMHESNDSDEQSVEKDSDGSWSSWDTDDDEEFFTISKEDAFKEKGQLTEREIYEIELQELERMEQLELELLTNNLSLNDN